MSEYCNEGDHVVDVDTLMIPNSILGHSSCFECYDKNRRSILIETRISQLELSVAALKVVVNTYVKS